MLRTSGSALLEERRSHIGRNAFAKLLIILHKTKKKEEKVSKGGHSCDRDQIWDRWDGWNGKIIEKINFFLISLLENLEVTEKVPIFASRKETISSRWNERVAP